MTRLGACLIFFSAALFAQQQRETMPEDLPPAFVQSDMGVILAVGLSSGGGFGDLVNEELKNQGYVTTGRMIFTDAELGMEFRVADRLFLLPRIGWIFTMLNRRAPFMIPMGEYDHRSDPYEIAMDDVTFFSMLTCSGGARYYLRETLPFLFYVEGDVGYLAAASRIGPLTFSPDALSAVVLAGYSFNWGSHAIGFELGYRSIPVIHPRITEQRASRGTRFIVQKEKRDFGGVVLNLVWRLDFFD